MPTARPRYRYITMGMTDLDTPICNIPLRPANGIALYSAVWRVTVPDDVELVPVKGCRHSNTDDTRRVRELDPIPMVKVDGHWRKMPPLANLPVYKWDDELVRQGYRPISCSKGFATE